MLPVSVAYFSLRTISTQAQVGDVVKLELFDGEETWPRTIGAAALEPLPNGEIEVDFGPADGAPLVRFVMSQDAAFELGIRRCMDSTANESSSSTTERG